MRCHKSPGTTQILNLVNMFRYRGFRPRSDQTLIYGLAVIWGVASGVYIWRDPIIAYNTNRQQELSSQQSKNNQSESK